MKYWIFFGFTVFLFLTGCAQSAENSQGKAGLLLPHPIDDQGWNSKGYQGMLNIQSNLGLQVFVKEDVNNRKKIIQSIEEFAEEGVNIIFGHSILFAEYFMEVKHDYPNIHFVSFNGEVEGENITSVHFEGYAMGYFAGMLSSEMTKTNKLGVIAAFPFQPEVQGFKDGAAYHNPEAKVTIEYMESWIDEVKAIKSFKDMKESGVDIFYPAGDGYHIPVIQRIKDSGLYGIGYVGDQIDLGETTILTSTVQHVEKLYENVTEWYLSGELSGGNKYFDFAEGVISLGEFSSEVPDETREWIEEAINNYIEKGLFPHEAKE